MLTQQILTIENPNFYVCPYLLKKEKKIKWTKIPRKKERKRKGGKGESIRKGKVKKKRITIFDKFTTAS